MTTLLIALPFILGLVGFIILEDLTAFPLFFILGFGISGCSFIIKSENETQTCKENSVKVIPQIVHVSDSSEKILKINGEHIKTIPRTSFEFFVAESLIVVDTCDNSISVKVSKND